MQFYGLFTLLLTALLYDRPSVTIQHGPIYYIGTQRQLLIDAYLLPIYLCSDNLSKEMNLPHIHNISETVEVFKRYLKLQGHVSKVCCHDPIQTS